MTNQPPTQPGQQPDSAQPGRPPVLDAEKRRQLVALLNKGCSRRTASIAVGCSPGTITRTANRDPEFAEQVAHAEAKLESKLLRRLDKASKKDRYWRAAGWLLERKFPDEYARRTPDLFTGEQVIQFFVTAVDAMEDALTADQYEQIIRKLDSILANSAPEPPLEPLLPIPAPLPSVQAQDTVDQSGSTHEQHLDA